MDILVFRELRKEHRMGMYENGHGECLDPRGSNMFMKVQKAAA
jgi:hypothetical protein